MDWTTLIPILPIVTLLLGWLLGLRSDKYREIGTQRALAYAAFLKAVAELAQIQRLMMKGDAEQREELRLLAAVAEAKARIAIYGSRAAIRALANFISGGAALDTLERMQAFSRLCSVFRRDFKVKGLFRDASTKDIDLLLFGIIVPKDNARQPTVESWGSPPNTRRP